MTSGIPKLAPIQETPWTEERVALLRKLHGEGHPFTLIADQLGGGITRNAAIGKARRLNLPERDRSMAQKRPYKPRDELAASPSEPKPPKEKASPTLAPSKVAAGEKRTALPALRPPKPVVVPSRIDATRQPATFLNLADDGCLYSLHSVDAIHMFCNQPVQNRSKYCSTHERASHDGFPKKKPNAHFCNGDDINGRKRTEV